MISGIYFRSRCSPPGRPHFRATAGLPPRRDFYDLNGDICAFSRQQPIDSGYVIEYQIFSKFLGKITVGIVNDILITFHAIVEWLLASNMFRANTSRNYGEKGWLRHKTKLPRSLPFRILRQARMPS